jgi:hyperosmotically inducible periplasmic protein
MKSKMCNLMLASLLLLSVTSTFSAVQESSKSQPNSGPSQEEILRIARAVHKAIVTLPQYGVFDNIHFGIKGRTVILRGQASRPTLKSSCENVVKKSEGVEAVDNQIEVLPLSPNDDRIRAQVYAKIYGSPALSRYTSNRGGGRYISSTRRAMGITNDPPIGWHAIHIIVKNGNVTLEGVVDNSGDLSIAGMQANTTPGVFSVQNNLQVAKEEKEK